MQGHVILFFESNQNTVQHISTLFNVPVCFFEACHDGVCLVKLGVIGRLMVVNEVTGFNKFLVCIGATLSGNLVDAGLILPLLNFWVNFSSVSTKWL